MSIQPKTASAPTLSVILPLSDAESLLPALGDALYGYLDSLGRSYEVVFVGHGRGERSATLLYQQHRLRPDVTRVLLGRGLASTAAATLAGLAACQGQRIITLTTDIYLAHETIGRVLDLLDLGHDFVAGSCAQDGLPAWKARLLKVERGLHTYMGTFGIPDPKCRVFGFNRELLDIVVLRGSGLEPELVPALAFRLARDPAEVLVECQPHGSGQLSSTTRQNLLGSPVQRVYYHLSFLIGPSSRFLQAFAVLAIGIGLLSGGSAILVTLFSLLFSLHEVIGLMLALFLGGVVFFGLGLFAIHLERLSNKRLGFDDYILDAGLHPQSRVERTK